MAESTDTSESVVDESTPAQQSPGTDNDTPAETLDDVLNSLGDEFDK